MNKVGTGTRAVNFFVDNIIVFTLTFFAFKTYNFYVAYWKYPFIYFGWFYLAITFVYYFLFEIITRRSLGKYVTHSIVVNTENTKPTFMQLFIRSLVRLTVIDMFFIPFLEKPLHDYLSKTEVVEK